MRKNLAPFLLYSVSFLLIVIIVSFHYKSNTNITLVNVHDGDTFTVNIKDYPPIIGEKIPIRINGIDCPELHDKNYKVRALAIKAKNFTERQLKYKNITLKNMKRDKYFRILADVYVNNQNLANLLLQEKLAKPYFGKTKPKW
jgi:micrococcal nuclease